MDKIEGPFWKSEVIFLKPSLAFAPIKISSFVLLKG